MAMNWNALFGQDYFVTITNEERQYLALDPIRDDWDITQYYSKTNYKYSRTTVFWDNDVIKKIIYEENRLPAGQTVPTYLNGMLTNQQVIEELLKLAQEIQNNRKLGDEMGLSQEEKAFYDALTRPAAIKAFYENKELVAMTKELTDTLRKSKTVDWQKRSAARAHMRMLIKKLLKKYKYPPEGMDDALETVMTQCELWTDNTDFSEGSYLDNLAARELPLVAEKPKAN